MSPAGGDGLGQRRAPGPRSPPSAARSGRRRRARSGRAAALRRVVPADLVLLVRVLVGVVAVAGERGQVDPADERDLVVDDHELLVVAVHHPAVQASSSALDLRAAARAARAPALTSPRRGWNTGTGAPAHTITRTGHALGRLGQQLAAPGVAVRGPGSKSGSRCHEQTCTWRWAPRIASAIRGSALAPSISTSSALPVARRRGGLRPQAVASPARRAAAGRGGAGGAGGGGSSRARCRRRRRHRSGRGAWGHGAPRTR